MKVGLIQFDVQHDWRQNISTTERHLQQLDADLVVLPELSACGYLFESIAALQDAAEPVPGGRTVEAMQKLSSRYGCGLVFGVAEEENGKIYNTAVLVEKGAYLGKYRKIHLSDFEKRFFTPGNRNSVFKIGDTTIGIQICFDLWFPEISRKQILEGAEVLCVLANFGGLTTSGIAKTRATENLTPLVLCNRIGREQVPELDAYFCGNSAVLDRTGEPLFQAREGQQISASCHLQPQKTRANVICRDFDAEIARHYPERFL